MITSRLSGVAESSHRLKRYTQNNYDPYLPLAALSDLR